MSHIKCKGSFSYVQELHVHDIVSTLGAARKRVTRTVWEGEGGGRELILYAMTDCVEMAREEACSN